MKHQIPCIDFGRDLCSNMSVSGRREWLVTNGIGGFASGTVAGLLTRRYHGLLIAALDPPLGRTLLVSGIHESATYHGYSYSLATNRWAGNTVDPKGYVHLERFHLEGTTPVWTYAYADALLEKRVWMQQGANTTYVHYELVRASHPLHLSLHSFVNYRDYHGITRAGDWHIEIDPVADGLRVKAFDSATPIYLLCRETQGSPQHIWYRDFFLDVEAYRGLDAIEDHLLAGTFEITLEPGSAVTLVASTDADPLLDGRDALYRRGTYESELIARSGSASALPEIQQLVLAADQFIANRPGDSRPDGKTIIAGYHWFGDWGRDTMIALPGLTLGTGRPHVAANILQTFAAYVDQGMLPNRFPDTGQVPEYNTVDATLWYFEAIRSYFEATGDRALLRELFPTLQDIVTWHEQGTRYGIHVDPEDGLLFSGEPGVQLTWMDVKVGDWVVTPRTGKPVEINALWYNALESIADFARILEEDPQPYRNLADRVRNGFDRFWNEAGGCCYDVIDTPFGKDDSVRPNQILAVSLPFSPLPEERQKGILDTCARLLLTSHGLRSLAPDHPDYKGHYGGAPAERDPLYHQGTVWAWLIGPFVAAHLRVHHDPIQARSFLIPLLQHLSDHGLGSISEIFDGDAPFTPRGCIAQAWSVAEVLRAWHLTTTDSRHNGHSIDAAERYKPLPEIPTQTGY